MSGPGLVEHGAKKDKEKDNGGRDIKWYPVNALGGHGHLADKSVERGPLEGDEIGHVRP